MKKNTCNYLIITLLAFSAPLASQTVTAVNAPFIQGKSMAFAYSGGTGSPTDWIGIYKKGQVPGGIASTLWQYVPGPAGTVTFEGTLDTGRYDVHLFCCDGYTKLASQLSFQVVAPRLRSRLVYYKTSDSLFFSSPAVIMGDRISVLKAADFNNGGVVSGAMPLIEKVFSAALTNATMIAPPTLPPGAYTVVLRNTNGLVQGFEPFEIMPATALPEVISILGLGSCASQNSPQPVLNHILQYDIDAFVFLGDNAYIDTYNEAVLRKGYETLLTKRTEFQKLRASVPLLATWDDHDYGCCDEDKDYPIKANSQKIFLDFWEEPANSPRRTQAGIYTNYTIGPAGQKLQIILLDTRYFLDNKRANNGCGKNDYCAWAGPGDADKTMLGPEQWQWLRNALSEPADLRMIASSVQFSSSYHGFEGWALFPYQRKKMQDLIKETRAEHVFFVSGDMHYSEVSKLDNGADGYPLYDFTASGINQSWPPEVNQNRVENKAYGLPNVGLLAIDWNSRHLTFTAMDAQNTPRFAQTVPFSDLEFKSVATQTPDPPETLQIWQASDVGDGMIRLSFSEKTEGQISIYNTAGVLIQQSNIQNSAFWETHTPAKGVFIAKMQTTKGKIAVCKLFLK